MTHIYESNTEQIDNGTDTVRDDKNTKFCVSTDLLQMNKSCVSAKNNEPQKFCNDENNESEKFRNRYRIPSARLRGYDYSKNGAYFVTICTKNREHFFGNIVDGRMHLSDIGEIVANEWQKTATIRENVELGSWVVMPNHFHAIVILNNDKNDRECRDVLPERLYTGMHPNMSQISPTKHSISNIIKFFKRQTTVCARKFCPDFFWQPRFHDHIIRDEGELNRISAYIVQNPLQWNSDDYCS